MSLSSAQPLTILRRVGFLSLRTVIQFCFYLWERCSDIVDWLDNRFSGLMMQREYIRVGQCAMTGQCCKAIGIEFPNSWLSHPRRLQWLSRWHALRFNFEKVGIHDNLLIYQCNYLRADNRCGIQRFKPKLCRDFPTHPWSGKIGLHKGCGYSYERRQLHDFKSKLHKRKIIPINSAREKQG